MQSCLFGKQTCLSYSLSRSYIVVRNYLQSGFLPCYSYYSIIHVLSQCSWSCFIFIWQICEYTPLSKPPLSHCSFSLSHSVPECLQKASILKHSVPGLNPTSDCFLLRDCWNSPCSDWFGSTKQLKPWMRILNIFLFCSLIQWLGYIFNFYLCFIHLLHLSWWKILSLSYSSFSFLSPETRCSFKMKVIEYLFWASFSHLGPECLPFLINAAVAVPCSCVPSLFQKHSARLNPQFHCSQIIEKCSLGLSKVLYWILTCLWHPFVFKFPDTFCSTCSHIINFKNMIDR